MCQTIVSMYNSITSSVDFEFDLLFLVNLISQVVYAGIVKVPLIVGVVFKHFKSVGDPPVHTAKSETIYNNELLMAFYTLGGTRARLVHKLRRKMVLRDAFVVRSKFAW